MVEDLEPLDISHAPEVLSLVEEVRADGRARVLQLNHQDVAILAPARQRAGKRRRAKPTSANDPLWNLVGLARSEHVDAHVAQAHAPHEG